MIDFDQLGAPELLRIRKALRAMPPNTSLATIDWQHVIEAARTLPESIDPVSGTVGDLLRELDEQKDRRRRALLAELNTKLDAMGACLRPRNPLPRHRQPAEADTELGEWEADLNTRRARGESGPLLDHEFVRLGLARKIAEMGDVAPDTDSDTNDEHTPRRRYRRHA